MSGRSDSQDRADKSAARKWAKEITQGLAYIHDQEIVHGHLKLENIWVWKQSIAYEVWAFVMFCCAYI